MGSASKTVSHTRSFRLTQTIGERSGTCAKVTIPKSKDGPGAEGVRSRWQMAHVLVHWQGDLTPLRRAVLDLAMVTLRMFLNRSPIVCVRRKLRVWDTSLEADSHAAQTEWL